MTDEAGLRARLEGHVAARRDDGPVDQESGAPTEPEPHTPPPATQPEPSDLPDPEAVAAYAGAAASLGADESEERSDTPAVPSAAQAPADPEPTPDVGEYPWQVGDESHDFDLHGAPTWDPGEHPLHPEPTEGDRGRRFLRGLLPRRKSAPVEPGDTDDASGFPLPAADASFEQSWRRRERDLTVTWPVSDTGPIDPSPAPALWEAAESELHSEAPAEPQVETPTVPPTGLPVEMPRSRPSPGPTAAPTRRPSPGPAATRLTRRPSPGSVRPRPAPTPHRAPRGEANSVRSGPPTDRDADEEGDAGRSARLPRWIVRSLIVLGIAAAAALLLREFVVQPYYIPSASMEPTLHGCPGCTDDRVLVDKISYRAHDVHQGDIVVFDKPKGDPSPEHVLIKRVVALPGDVLELKQGHVYVNGLQLDEPYVNKKCGSAPTRPLTATTEWKIPSGAVFVMGDNRCHSDDSRAFGPIPTSSIVGRAFAIIWPLSRIGGL